MEEEKVRLVMMKYFDSKGIRVIPSKGKSSGPDFFVDGKAIEVKGSDVRYDFPRMLKQITDYALKYSRVELALPFDGLSLEQAVQLGALHNIIDDVRDFKLRVYLITPNPKNDSSFFVKDVKYPSLILGWMTPQSSTSYGLDLKNKDSTVENAVDNLIGYSPTAKLRGELLSPSMLDTIEVEI